jgi:hypothetical protein
VTKLTNWLAVVFTPFVCTEERTSEREEQMDLTEIAMNGGKRKRDNKKVLDHWKKSKQVSTPTEGSNKLKKQTLDRMPQDEELKGFKNRGV